MTKNITPLPTEWAEEPITRAQAAELAGVHERTIDRWANEGLVTRFKVGGLQWVRFDRAEILAMRQPAPAETSAGYGSASGEQGE